MRNNRPLMTVTLMGGDMQSQGIAQVLVNVLDLGANLQAATDMARFRHGQVANMLSLESRLFGLVGAQLKAMGHIVSRSRHDLGAPRSCSRRPNARPAAGLRYSRPGILRGGVGTRKGTDSVRLLKRGRH